MFVKEAEEVVKRNVCGDCNTCQSHGYIGCNTYRYSRDSYLRGARDGYTKGKEEAEAWCYPSEGQFPEKDMHCLVQWQDESISDVYFAIDGNGEAYLVGSKRFPKEIVAWKEIIPPKRKSE